MTNTGHTFKGTCHGCKRGMVTIELHATPSQFRYARHSYVIGFGTPAQALVVCVQSGEVAPGHGL